MKLPECYKKLNHPIILENILDIDSICNVYVKYFEKDIEDTKDDPLKYLYRIDGIVHDSENLDDLKVVFNPITFNSKPIGFVQDFNEFFSLVDKKKYPNAKQKFKFESIPYSEIFKSFSFSIKI